ncbi:hypothetical protein FA95DRAFT_1601155 [Auriscalpium vulgare]|uniref:Uncharacterized protein n=1 Tax=Auriscalpium vulgare TaxID=40419 RepID=A0ACB8SA94_9AGAM|nr:hypothetical protein FA95DRAFT_1601155 [Auriscalpium vulgare]
MPACPSPLCPLSPRDRMFATVDALVDHARETRALHALCGTCFRIFRDPEALAQHVEAKHVVNCESCSRKFKSQAALDQHYRASASHPSCPVCEIGLANNVVFAEHIANAHPRIRCCGVAMYEKDLGDHFLLSRNHPKCAECTTGFAGRLELADHNAAVHPELQCSVCSKHFASAQELQAHKKDPASHRKCEFCSEAFKDTAALVEHFTATHLIQEYKEPVGRAAKTLADASSSSSTKSVSRPQSRTTVASSKAKASVFVDVASSLHTCEYCGTGFEDTSALVQHFTSKHVAEESVRKSVPADSLREALLQASMPATPASVAPSSRFTYPSEAEARETKTPITRSTAPADSRRQAFDQASMPATPTASVAPSSRSRFPPEEPETKTPITRSMQPSISEESDITDRHSSRRPSISSETDLAYVFTSPISSPSSIGTFTPSPRDSLLGPSATPPPPRASIFSPSRASEAIARALNGSASGEQTPSPPARRSLPVTPPIITTPAPRTPVTPNAALDPTSSRSKASVAETPSGDLSNFHLLKGSPLMSVKDMDLATPTSTRTASVSPAAARLARRTKSVTSAVLPTALSPFYCRGCRADPCVEITATACGHVFCNRCIVQEVRQNARCPVCNAAVLLFALLKLDV